MTSTTVTRGATTEATAAGTRRRAPVAGAGPAARVPGRDRPGLAVPGGVGGVQLLPRLRLHLGARLCLPGRVHVPELPERLGAGEFTRHFLNSLYITVPAVLLTLFLASCVAFVVARFSFRFLILLGLFTAANLLPQQALLIPLFRLYREVPLPLWMSDSGQLLDSYWGLILVNTAFQTGFCTFVLSNYMKALPHEMFEAARVDGAGVPTQFFRITLPLCRPALAGHPPGHLDLQRVLLGHGADAVGRQVSHHQLPHEPAGPVLHRLQPALGRVGGHRHPRPGGVLPAQKQFVAGLTLGSTKG